MIYTAEAICALLEQHCVKGFLPHHEAAALFNMALTQAAKGPLLEVGSFCGKSAVYLGAAAQCHQQILFTVDHHLGSEEHQQGEGYHDPKHFDAQAGRVDTLPHLRKTLRLCAMEDSVIPIIARSEVLAGLWGTPLAMVFIDGGHSEEQAKADCLGWAPHLMAGGMLAIHDIFEHPEEGGQAPYLAMQAVMAVFNFVLIGRVGSMVFLEKQNGAQL